MSDLIERLRTERSVYDAELCDEAADEIERLECHLAISKGKHTSAIEEIERLREALGKICSLLSPTTGYWIALKALEDSDE